MSEKKEVESELKPGVSVDVGTSFLVTSRQKKDGTFVNKFYRNCLLPMDINDESTDLLERSNYFHIKTKDQYFVVGEDAISLVSAIGKGEVVRCMRDGFLNPDLSSSSDLLFDILSSLVGKPIIEGENLRFSIPASPIDRDVDNVFHKMVLQGFFTKLGYDAKPINEAMAVGFNDNPIMKGSDGQEVPLTGIAISFGAGMQNLVLLFRGMSLMEFSCTKSGDHIDEMVSKVTGVSKDKVIRIKERSLNLDKIDDSDRVSVALGIYYDELISRVIHNISNKFKEKKGEVDGMIEIVVAGGTSLPLGFCKRFEDKVMKSDIPFKIYRVRHSQAPFFAVSQGACLRAQSDYKKALGNRA